MRGAFLSLIGLQRLVYCSNIWHAFYMDSDTKYAQAMPAFTPQPQNTTAHGEMARLS